MKQLIGTALLALGLLAGHAQANDEEAAAALYDAAAPSDSAFVRVLNLSTSSVSASLSGKNQAQQIGAGQVGGYRFTPPGATRLEVADQSLQLQLEANSASTLVFDGSGLRQIRDSFVDEPKKAQIGFYNLSGQPLALKTADGRHVIVDNLQPGESGGRMVNELKIAFAAYQGEQKVADFPELFLKKGRTYSYLILPDAGGLRALGLANGLDPLD